MKKKKPENTRWSFLLFCFFLANVSLLAIWHYEGALTVTHLLATNIFLSGVTGILYFHHQISNSEVAESKKDRDSAFTSPELIQVLNKLPDSVIMTDENGYITSANYATELLLGYTPSEIKGKHITFLYQEREHDFLKDNIKELLKTTDDYDVELQAKGKSGEYIYTHLKITPLPPERKKVAGMIFLSRSIDEQKTAEKTLKTVHETRFAYTQLLQDIAMACTDISTVGDTIQIFLDKICKYTGWSVGHAYISTDVGQLIPTGIWHVDNVEIFKPFMDITADTTFRYGEGLPGKVFKEKKPVWIKDVTLDESCVRARRMPDIPIRAAFAFPVMEKGSVVASLEFFSTEVVEPDDFIVNFVGYIASQLGRVTEKKRMEEEVGKYNLKLEKALYRANDVLNILSIPPKIIPGFVVSNTYRTVKTVGGGDTIKWLDFRSRYAALYIHDVSGHDIQEILLNILATALADIYKTNPSRKTATAPSVFLENMNEKLRAFCAETSHFLTAAYVLMDFDHRKISLSLAGHPKPWLISSDGTTRQIGNPGYLMGQFEIKNDDPGKYMDTSIELKSGEILLLYTDGLMEQRDTNGTSFEKKFMEKVLPALPGRSPGEAYQLLKAEYEKHLDTQKADDDVSWVFLGLRPEEDYEAIEFIPSPTLMEMSRESKINIHRSATIQDIERHHDRRNSTETPDCKVINEIGDSYASIVAKAKSRNWSETNINRIEMALGEMVINAIMHGNLCSDRYSVKVAYIFHDDILEVLVEDEGTGFDGKSSHQKIEPKDLVKEHGRGLHIAGAFADAIYFNDAGNKSWALFRNIS